MSLHLALSMVPLLPLSHCPQYVPLYFMVNMFLEEILHRLHLISIYSDLFNDWQNILAEVVFQISTHISSSLFAQNI
jgi:hypothetical protein